MIKITIAIKPISEHIPPEDMALALTALQSLREEPLGKITLILECPDKDTADEVQQAIDDAFAEVPLTIDVNVKTLDERGVSRRSLQPLSMERLWTPRTHH